MTTEEVRGNQWQPIATAPKSGPVEHVLLKYQFRGNEYIVVGHWAYGDGDGFQPAFGPAWFQSNGSGGWFELPAEPTHWRPIDAAPSPGILAIRQRIEAALMKVAENVAKHTIGRSGWHPDDSCFRVDLREAQAEIESLIPCLLAAPQDLCRARGCGHSVAYHDRATHQCGVAYCECEQFTETGVSDAARSC